MNLAPSDVGSAAAARRARVEWKGRFTGGKGALNDPARFVETPLMFAILCDHRSDEVRVAGIFVDNFRVLHVRFFATTSPAAFLAAAPPSRRGFNTPTAPRNIAAYAVYVLPGAIKL